MYDTMHDNAENIVQILVKFLVNVGFNDLIENGFAFAVSCISAWCIVILW